MIDEITAKANIRKARESHGSTQVQVAEEIGISVTALKKIETGSTRIINRNAYAIARSLGISPEKLMLGYDPVDSSDPSLRSEVDLKEAMEELKSYYEARLKGKTDEIAQRDERIAKLEAEVKRLDDFSSRQQVMIDFLQKHTNL